MTSEKKWFESVDTAVVVGFGADENNSCGQVEATEIARSPIMLTHYQSSYKWMIKRRTHN